MAFKQIYTDDINYYLDFCLNEDDARVTRAEDFATAKDRLEVLTANTIIAIGDIMTLDGRRTAYKLMGNCVNQILYSKDNRELTVYYDGKDVRAEDRTDGGFNYYTYRELKDEKGGAFPLLKKIYNQERVTQNDIDKYTNSLEKYMIQIYGSEVK